MLQHSLSTISTPLRGTVSETITPLLAPLFPSPDQDLKSLNDTFLVNHARSPAHLLAGVQARRYLDESTSASSADELLQMLAWAETGLEDACAGLDLLRRWGVDEEAYRVKAHGRWADATIFMPKAS
jgi:hypothetical protein